MESIKSPSNLYDFVSSHQSLDWEGHWQLLNWVPRVGRGLGRVLKGTADRFSTPLTVAAHHSWRERAGMTTRRNQASLCFLCLWGNQKRPTLDSHRKEYVGIYTRPCSKHSYGFLVHQCPLARHKYQEISPIKKLFILKDRLRYDLFLSF